MIGASHMAAAWRIFSPRLGARHPSDAELIAQIRAAAASLTSLADDGLSQRMAELRGCVEQGQSVTCPKILIPGFALIIEASRRVLSINLYDSQILGGLALARGAIAEMQTGEGKTYAALLPAALHALAGQGVHVMTVNAYLAERDFQLLVPVHQRLGLSVGMLKSADDPAAKRAAYACDITYGPGYEFGFDYLRDQLALISQRKPRLGETFRDCLHGRSNQKPSPVQRGRAVAIVDEADSVLLDEATTPLVLASSGAEPAANADVYLAAQHTASQLTSERHFVVDRAAATLHLTQAGIERLAARSADCSLTGLDRPWQAYVEQALRAQHLFQRDTHYVVREGEVQIVDQYTGRIFSDRSWREGLQQAVQAKEQLTITSEPKSLARITRQRFIRLYSHLCGMTGTAQGNERELRAVYGLRVVVIPLHRPCRRQMLTPRVFVNRQFKENAIADEIAQRHRTGQPVLVGTAAIQSSERLARLLDERQIRYQLLNGKQNAEEASIIACAGELGAVTIATNMAGRGTDIKLSPQAAAAGGLHVIATEPQESARIDRQLFGRAARQGDPGSCQLFIAFDDSLFEQCDRRFASRQLTLGTNGELVSSGFIVSQVARIQNRIEHDKANQRRQMFAHDDWLVRILRELV